MAKKAPTPKPAKVVGPSLKLTTFEPSTVADVIAATGATKSNKMLMVPIDQIVEVPGFNLRITDTEEYERDITETKDSILAEGFYESQPLGCFPASINGEPKMVVISGHRRFDAAKRAVAEGADITALPVVLRKPTTDSLAMAVSLHKENLHVRPSMMERAVLAHRLLRSGMNEEQTAERLNVTQRHINDLKVLIAAPRAVRDLVKHGKIAATEVITRLRNDQEGGAEKILAAAAKAEEKAVEKAAEKAAKGDATAATKAEKLTKASIENEGVKPPKMQVHRANFAVGAGEEFLYEDAEPFLRVIGDETWFKNARSKLKRVALEPIEVEVKIRRMKSVEETEAEAAATAKGGKKPAAEAEVDDSDLGADDGDGGFDDDDNGGAPDLRTLGIAEPANSEL